MTKFLYCVDLHYGYERVNGHKKPLHDLRAMNAMLQFAKDFKPDEIILGGDMLDCGLISHHNHGKPGATEGLKLRADATELQDALLTPLECLGAKKLVYIEGNHEAWLNQLIEAIPTLEGLLELDNILDLSNWKVIPQGGQYDLGKLTFLHGDTVTGGEHVAKQAVINYERSVRFGHFHGFSAYTKSTPTDTKNPKTGMSIGCLCRKGPGYGKNKPNKWSNGFLYGYVDNAGYFNDYPITIIDGRFIAPSGKLYKG